VDESRDGRGGDGGVQQKVRSEHRRLDELFVEVGAVFAPSGGAEEMRDAFSALSEAIDLHFEQEERLYYASIGALRPDVKPEIAAISEAHRRFRLTLAAIGDQLERGDLAGARRGFTVLASAFQDHEAVEEHLLHRVEEAAGLGR
jgi:hypothetical protein